MIAACANHIPIGHRIPAGVTIVRHGRHLAQPPPGSAAARAGVYLQRFDSVRVNRAARVSPFRFTYSGNVYWTHRAAFTVYCPPVLLESASGPPRRRVLSIVLSGGKMAVRAGPLPRQALVLTDEMLALATLSGTTFEVTRNPSVPGTWAWTLNRPIVAAVGDYQSLRIRARLRYTASSTSSGLKLDVWPFAKSPLQRPTTAADGLAPYWADGRACSTGCTAAGVAPGWPLQPFRQQHPIRAGIDEVRPAGPHVAIDIDAQNFQPVYAIQSGYASIRYPGTGDVNVDVGNFDYWHIKPLVSPGQYVVAYRTEIGTVLYNFRHLAVSELSGGYINPLRPGGSLLPYSDNEPPIIGVPQIYSDGRVIVGAFDPQSFVDTQSSYETPVLAPAGLAWRLYDDRGNDLTGLQWAQRSSQVWPPGEQSVVYAPGAMNPGYACFAAQRRCIPRWVYWLAGGDTERLPLDRLANGRYRLTIYASDFAGNTSALDYRFTVPLAHAASAPFGPLDAQYDP